MRATMFGAGAFLAAGGFAQSSSACTGQQYNVLPGFPAMNSGCYPLGYYQTSDLGQTSPSDAMSRCQQQCTSMGSQCGSVVAQVNKAADSNLYPSGTCFFYSQANSPTGPRQCADTAYLLEGYKKDNTLACFSSSASAATQFCSSYLSIPVNTVTATSTPPPVTSTTTQTGTTTIFVPSTISATSTVLATTSSTSTTTVTTITSTSTATSTVFTTMTVTVTPARRMAKRAIITPACVTSGTPATRLSAACSCLSIHPSTTTTTTTLIPVTSTSTAKTTLSITATQLTTVTSATVTSTITVPVVASTSATTFTTTTTTTTMTVTATATATSPPQCQFDDYSTSGGCSSNCFCDTDAGGGAICDTQSTFVCGTSCSSDAGCPSGYACASSSGYVYTCGAPQCVPYTGCTSTYNPTKRSITDGLVAIMRRNTTVDPLVKRPGWRPPQ